MQYACLSIRVSEPPYSLVLPNGAIDLIKKIIIVDSARGYRQWGQKRAVHDDDDDRS